MALLAKRRVSLAQQQQQPNIMVNLGGLHDLLPQSRTTNNPLPPTLPLPQKLSLREFCNQYDLSDGIHAKMSTQDIAGPHTLHFFTDIELMDTVHLTLGQRGSVRDAAERWAQDSG